MTWDTRIAIGLFVLCIVGPAVMTHPTAMAAIVTGVHVVLLILFGYVVRHIGRREEREDREAAFGLNQPLTPAVTSQTGS